MKKTFLNSKLISKKEIKEYDFIFLGVPYEKGCSGRKGTKMGPNAIREKSLQYSWPEWNGFYDPSLDKKILTAAKIADLGDNPNSFGEDVKKISNYGKIPVVVGGDHSISFDVVKNLNQKVQIIHLDAHGDYQRAEETDASPSGMVIRKINGLKNVNKIIQLGMRGYLNSKRGFDDSRVDENSVIPWDKYKTEGKKLLFNEIKKGVPTYLTLDSDFLDPSICPGTTVPEPNGAMYHEIKDLLIGICQKTKIVGFDVVEYNPRYDVNEISSLYLTKIILDLISYIFESKK